jgi:proline-specific peptidase
MRRILILAAFCIVIVLLAPASLTAQLAHSQPEWYLPTGDGCQLFVQEYGQGPEMLVVLHGGWGAEHSYLLEAFKGLEYFYHLVFYDQRGSLRSPCAVDKISVQKHVEDLEHLRAALGVERMNIVAHSMGTYLAMTYLQQYPERVKGLVLMGAIQPKSPKTDAEKALWKEQDEIAKAFIERPEVAAEMHRQGLDKDQNLLTPQEKTNAWRIRFAGVNLVHVDRWRQMKGGRVFYNAATGEAAGKTMPQEYDFTPALKAHQCPVWVLDGDHDYVDPGAKKFQMATAGFPNVRFVIIKEASHASWWDAPQQFPEALLKALESTIECK